MAASALEEGKMVREKQRVYRLGRRQGVWRGGRLGMEEGVREEEEEGEEEEGEAGHKAEKRHSGSEEEREGGGEGGGEGRGERGAGETRPRHSHTRRRWKRPIDEREYWKRVERVWSVGRLPQYQDESAR